MARNLLFQQLRSPAVDELEDDALVTEYSIGFCVARTKNGEGRLWVSPWIVTCLSCIASRSADWTLGGARLISSASTKFAKTGPGLVPGISGIHQRVISGHRVCPPL